MTLRVLTYNIRKGKGPYHARGSISALANGLLGSGAHVILCQEVFHEWEETGTQQTEFLANSLALATTYGPNATYLRGHHGNATFTRLAIRNSFNTDLSTNRFERRGVLYSQLEGDDGTRVHVFNTHLGLNRVQRRKQIRVIAELIDALCVDGAPVLLAGDFNDWTGGLDRHVIEHCGLHNALSELSKKERRSWPSFRPLFGLDRIYFRGMELVGARVLAESPWQLLSDHLPVTADFELGPVNGTPQEPSGGDANASHASRPPTV